MDELEKICGGAEEDAGRSDREGHAPSLCLGVGFLVWTTASGFCTTIPNPCLCFNADLLSSNLARDRILSPVAIGGRFNLCILSPAWRYQVAVLS